MLNWSTRFNICCFLDNHNYQISPHSYECILAAGALQFIEAKSGDAFNQLKVFSDAQPDWLFGHFSYDLKNEIGFTTIFISHDLGVVHYISDRIMVMNKGKIEESGSADEIYYHPKSPYTQKLIASIPKMAF